MAEQEMHFGLPVVNGYAWAFSEEMIYDAWARYVAERPDHFTSHFLMSCASLPPQVEEAIAVVRGPSGKMPPDVVRLIQKQSQRVEFHKKQETCPRECVCPGSFEAQELATLPDSVREALWQAGLAMGITPTKSVFRVKVSR